MNLIGASVTREFAAYISLYKMLPNLIPILQRNGNAIAFPEEPLVRYAIATSLTVKATNATHVHNAFN